MRNLPARHQHSIVPQKRDRAGQYAPKPGRQLSASTRLKAQALPSMPLSTLGPTVSPNPPSQ